MHTHGDGTRQSFWRVLFMSKEGVVLGFLSPFGCTHGAQLGAQHFSANKKGQPNNMVDLEEVVVAGEGVEPPTQGFSVSYCSGTPFFVRNYRSKYIGLTGITLIHRNMMAPTDV